MICTLFTEIRMVRSGAAQASVYWDQNFNKLNSHDMARMFRGFAISSGNFIRPSLKIKTRNSLFCQTVSHNET